MSILRTITYLEWSESNQKVTRELQQTTVPNEEICIRKLVNATMMRNQLYEHTSNESEDALYHFIYAKPFTDLDLAIYGGAIKPALSENCAPSSQLVPEFLFWNGYKFEHGRVLSQSTDLSELAQMLLDHYLVVRGRTYESLYSVFDTDRSKIVFYLKEVLL